MIGPACGPTPADPSAPLYHPEYVVSSWRYGTSRNGLSWGRCPTCALNEAGASITMAAITNLFTRMLLIELIVAWRR
jgi:hypothetical protein